MRSITRFSMKHPNEDVMKQVIATAKEKGVIVAAIVKDDELISMGWNEVNISKDASAHAEIQAIRKASKKLGKHKLHDCWLYSSFEPCPMCSSAAVWARIKGIVYGANMKDTNKKYTQRILIPCEEIINRATHKVLLHKDYMRDECLEVMRD